MNNGQGNGGVYPTLVGSPWVTGSEERLIKLALHGMWGKLVVRGKTYDPARGVPPMTAFRDLLKDDELADVLTFVRNTWGNKASPIDRETVGRVRGETSRRSVFWKPEELLESHPLEKELMAAVEDAEEAFSNELLEQELLAEPAAKLAKIAIAKGRVAYGKELFFRSAAACAACHDTPAGTTQIGPDLTKPTKKLSNEDLVNSILRPSQSIEKEFAQVKVLTFDGLVLTGILISQTEEKIVIRGIADPKPITVLMDDVEDIADVKTSAMPEGLVKLLKDRQQFNDLMKYVIEIQQ